MILKITVTKTSRGDQDYIQVMSDDQVSVNVVLVANRIDLEDLRTRPAEIRRRTSPTPRPTAPTPPPPPRRSTRR